MVLETVSMLLAVKYVEKYKEKMRRNGFEARNRCGVRRAGVMARFKQRVSEVPVAAFSTIDLSSVSHMVLC